MNKNSKKIDVICFGGEDWWYKNRGHNDMQLMRRYTKYGTILYINSIVMQKPKLCEGMWLVRKVVRKARSIFAGLKKSDAGFWVYSPFSLPVHHIAYVRKLNEWLLRFQVGRIKRKLKMKDPIVWVACPAATDVAIKMYTNKLVYQRTDRYEEYPNVDRKRIKQYDQKAKVLADLTIFANIALYKEEWRQCHRALFLDHGVDYELFANADRCDHVPADIRRIPHPILGFYGSIDNHTSNVKLIEEVAHLLPDISVVLIGNSSLDLSALASLQNVYLLSQKPYEQIPHYAKCFDVCFMPWQQNRWIRACNPIKLKEYLALGKPIVSTPFPELQRYLNLIYQARTSVDFAKCVRRAITENSDELIARRRKTVQEASWDSKAQLVLEALFGNNQPNESKNIGACCG